MFTQRQLSLQMIAQLRLLDPSVSAEVGTPERKIIDTVAQALSESQIDLGVLTGNLDIDSKFGTDLDRFLGIFGFGRQKAVAATGFVTFSRESTSNYNIPIAQGVRVIAPSVPGDIAPQQVIYQTMAGVILPAGDLQVIAPVACIVAGTIGNVGTNMINGFGTTVIGITAVINEAPILGGVDQESDDEYKLRFKNTFFRNLSGTQDQFLALAVSTSFTTKANVVGPISRYREYIQVPDVDDASADPDSGRVGNGSATEYTSALSTLPYSKHIYDTIPYFVTSTDLSGQTLFYRQDTDYYLNTAPTLKDRGDAYRGRFEGDLSALDSITQYQPDITFRNVFTGEDAAVQAVRPKDIVLFEHSYMSTASRNDYTRNVTNCVDVYINGENKTLADSVIALPSVSNHFSADPANPYYYENFRRIGEPNHRPVIGNIATPLFWSPVVALPDSLIVDTSTYYLGVHYWLIKDVSLLGTSVRARDGIEWAANTRGALAGNLVDGPYTGALITANAATAVEIDKYSYDKNIIDLQAALESNKQITTDALCHTATVTYLKLDLTIMYAASVSISDTNDVILESVQGFFDNQYFGSAIQLSDLLQAVHNVVGVDNVRWSKEILTAQGLTTDTSGNPRDRVIECDVFGNSLVNVILDRKITGDGSTVEVWNMYLTGNPTGGSYTVSYADNTTTPIPFDADAAAITPIIELVAPIIAASGTGTPADPFVLTFSGVADRLPDQLSADATNLLGGTYAHNSDFFLNDDQIPSLPTDQLATDSRPGLILRQRAQNVWNQL